MPASTAIIHNDSDLRRTATDEGRCLTVLGGGGVAETDNKNKTC